MLKNIVNQILLISASHLITPTVWSVCVFNMGKVSISVLVLLFCIVHFQEACKPKPRPAPKCSWRTCTASYDANFGPAPGDHKCVHQRKKVRHHYQTHTRQGTGCSNVPCNQRDQERDWCKYLAILKRYT